MPFSRPYRLTISLLALLAISWAQTFGIHRGWLCEHGDEQFITQTDHCHGDHSAAEHQNENHSTPHQHDNDDSDTQPLPEVKDSLLAKQQDVGTHDLVILVPSIIAEVSWIVQPARLALLKHDTKPPNWPQRLTQSISLRV